MMLHSFFVPLESLLTSGIIKQKRLCFAIISEFTLRKLQALESNLYTAMK